MSNHRNYDWDQNIALNDEIRARRRESAEELFVSCFEIYVADKNGVFSKRDNFDAVIELAADLENLSLEPLFHSLDLLSLFWRPDAGHTDANDKAIKTYLDQWSYWIKKLPDHLKKEKTDLLALIVEAVLLRGSEKGGMLAQNLNRKMEEQYLKPILSEKQGVKPKQKASKELKKTLGGLPAMTVFILILVVGVARIFEALGYNFYVGYGDEAPARMALYAVIGAALCLFIALILIADLRLKRTRATNIAKLETKALKPFWLGSLFCLIYALLSVVLDWVTADYLYQPDSNYFIQLGLICIYSAAAFFTLALWMMVTQIGPYSRKKKSE